MDNNLYDLIIIGSGSAGMSAGLYAGRAKLKTLIIDKDKAGGQIKITSEVVNYPGIFQISGEELGSIMKKQSQNFGASYIDAEVLDVDFSSDIKKVKTSNGDFESLGVIIASGAKARELGFEGEKEYQGRGIGYCATCDGEFFTGLDVFVIGAGFAAAEEAIYLTRFAKKVTVIAREPEFTCSKTIADKVLKHPKIEVMFNTEVVSIGGDKVLKHAKFVNNETNEIWEYEVDNPKSTFGVFIFVGYMPSSDVFKGHIELDDYGYIITDEDMKTNVNGVYAAGDIRPKKLRQLVTAVSDGAIAATNIEKYIVEQKEKLGIQIKEEHTASKQVESLFDEDIKSQLTPILERFENKISIVAILDRSSETYSELRTFLNDFSSLTDNVEISIYDKGEDVEKERKIGVTIFPAIVVMDKNGDYTGIQFHGIPGGHEMNSFILALYNTAGPGQNIDKHILTRINNLSKKFNIKVAVSLSCTLCPDVVVSSQVIALNNRNIEAEMLDISKFTDIKNKFGIMSVPAVIVNDDDVLFGKKTLEELVSHLESL